MKVTNKTKTSEENPNNNFEILCQGFVGGNFYGLEYILDDFFQNTTVKPSVPVHPVIDWFGLYQQKVGRSVRFAISGLFPATDSGFIVVIFCKVTTRSCPIFTGIRLSDY